MKIWTISTDIFSDYKLSFITPTCDYDQVLAFESGRIDTFECEYWMYDSARLPVIDITNKGISSILHTGSIGFACNENTFRILNDISGNKLVYATLTPMNTSGNLPNYLYVNVRNEVDCLDLDRSLIEYIGGLGGVPSIKQYVFLPSKLQNEMIFTIPETGIYTTYVTDTFKNLVEEKYNITGFVFEEVWSSEASD